MLQNLLYVSVNSWRPIHRVSATTFIAVLEVSQAEIQGYSKWLSGF